MNKQKLDKYLARNFDTQYLDKVYPRWQEHIADRIIEENENVGLNQCTS